MPAKKHGVIVETPTEARQAEPGPSILLMLTLSTVLAVGSWRRLVGVRPSLGTRGQRTVVLTLVTACTGESFRQCRAASTSESEAPLFRAHVSAAEAEYFAT
jgi:hypothetical protein